MNYFIDKAQKNSPLLTDYNNQIKSAALDSLLNKSTRKPQVNANLFGYYAPIISGYGYDNPISNGQMLTGLVGVNQKIVGKNNVGTQLESFKLIKDGLILNKKIAIKDLNRVIISQYITTSATFEQMEYILKTTAVLNEGADILKKLTQNSVYKQTDYLLYSSAVKQQELFYLQLKHQYQNNLGLLHLLSGETDTTYVKLLKPDVSLKTIAPPAKSIFFKQFEVDSLKLRNQKKLIDLAYRPSVSLIGDAGYESTFTYIPYKNFGVSMGFGISLPIYDGNQRNFKYEKTALASATNLAYKKTFGNQYRQQLLLLNQKLNQVLQIDNQLRSQLKIAEALIEADKKLLLTGDVQITEFVIAIQNLISIQNSLAQNNINRLQLINDINYWSYNE